VTKNKRVGACWRMTNSIALVQVWLEVVELAGQKEREIGIEVEVEQEQVDVDGELH